jgi:hypothetical protein
LAYSGNDSITGIDSATEKIYTGAIGGTSVHWTDVSNNTHSLKLRKVSAVGTASPMPVYASGDYGTMIYSQVTSPSSMTFSTIWLPVKEHVNAVAAPLGTAKGLFAGNFDSVYAFT